VIDRVLADSHNLDGRNVEVKRAVPRDSLGGGGRGSPQSGYRFVENSRFLSVLSSMVVRDIERKSERESIQLRRGEGEEGEKKEQNSGVTEPETDDRTKETQKEAKLHQQSNQNVHMIDVPKHKTTIYIYTWTRMTQLYCVICFCHRHHLLLRSAEARCLHSLFRPLP
jgi:hypothetical protein